MKTMIPTTSNTATTPPTMPPINAVLVSSAVLDGGPAGMATSVADEPSVVKFVTTDDNNESLTTETDWIAVVPVVADDMLV